MKILSLERGAPTVDTVVPGLFNQNGDEQFDINRIIQKNPTTTCYAGSNLGGQNFIGFGPLRETLALKHKIDDNRRIITEHGGMKTMSLVLTKLLRDRGIQRKEGKAPDREITVATEIPTYDRFPMNLANHNMDWQGVRLTKQGLDLEKLESLVSSNRIDLFYAIPVAQNYSGYNYSTEEMRSIEKICATAGDKPVPVLWDMAYDNLTYGWQTETVDSNDQANNVIYSYNYTKELSAGLKNGYLLIPEIMKADFDNIVQNRGLNPVYPVQAWLNNIINDSLYKEHLNFLCNKFHGLAQVTQAEVDKLLQSCDGALASTNKIDSGYFVGVKFPGIKTDEMHDKFLQILREDFATPTGDVRPCYTPEYKQEALGEVRIPWACNTPEDIQEIFQRLREGHQKTLRT